MRDGYQMSAARWSSRLNVLTTLTTVNNMPQSRSLIAIVPAAHTHTLSLSHKSWSISAGCIHSSCDATLAPTLSMRCHNFFRLPRPNGKKAEGRKEGGLAGADLKKGRAWGEGRAHIRKRTDRGRELLLQRAARANIRVKRVFSPLPRRRGALLAGAKWLFSGLSARRGRHRKRAAAAARSQ